MFWYVAKVAVSEGSVAPGTTDHCRLEPGRHAPEMVCPIWDVYGGRVVKVLCYDLEDKTCLCKWEGTPPMDWFRVTTEQARAHFLAKKGHESHGVN